MSGTFLLENVEKGDVEVAAGRGVVAVGADHEVRAGLQHLLHDPLDARDGIARRCLVQAGDLGEQLIAFHADALDPVMTRVLVLGGSTNDFVSIPIEHRFGSTDWTVEMWVCPDPGWTGGGR